MEAPIKVIVASIAAKKLLIQQAATAVASAEREAVSKVKETATTLAKAATAQTQATRAQTEAANAKTTAQADEFEAAEALEKVQVQMPQNVWQAAQTASQTAQLKAQNSRTASQAAHQKSLIAMKQVYDAEQNAAEALRSEAATKRSAADARKTGESARETLSDLAAALLPLKNKLAHAVTCSVVDSTQALVFVESSDLREVLTLMQARTSPTIYDFQGMDMKYLGRGDLRIFSNGVTWQNGRILLDPGMDLVCRSSSFCMKSVKVIGGACGVSIASGQLTMTDCEVRGCNVGVQMTGWSSLQASNLRLVDCADCALFLQDSSHATFSEGCEFSGARSNIYMMNSSRMGATGMTITGTDGYVITMSGSTRLTLTGSTLQGRPGETAGILQGEASLVMISCKVDGKMKVESSKASLKIMS